MRRASRDREAIIHFAGFQRLSPALDGESRPTFSAAAGDGLARCGWESFFRAMRAHDLSLEYDPEDAGSVRFVPAAAAHDGEERAPVLPRALHDTRRFWKALTG